MTEKDKEINELRREVAQLRKALEEAEPKHGQWEPSDYDRYYQCSECGSYTHEENLWDYCPSCGADMREVENETGRR